MYALHICSMETQKWLGILLEEMKEISEHNRDKNKTSLEIQQ